MSEGSTGTLLDVGDGHRIWVQTVGQRDGIPSVYLHGGPGSGCNPSQHKLFDPDTHFAVFVDQRGAGRSQPHGERRANTTAHLIRDLEKVRQHLGIERWLVVGGSWGATLALAYAQAHPERVTGIVLRATFLGTSAELDWAFNQALPAFQPDLYAALMAQCDGRLATLWSRILDPDPAIHTAPARAFGTAERALSDLSPAAPRTDGPLPASAFMEAHYFAHDCFLEPGALMRDAGKLAGIPGVVVQARLDLLCPPVTSAQLVAAWPDARLVMVEAAGHSLGHRAVFDAVREGIAALSSA